MEKGSDNEFSEGEVAKLRAKIDEIDAAVLKLIARRKDVAVEIARIKQKIGSQDDEGRLMAILEKIGSDAEKEGLDPEAIKEIWKKVIVYMIDEQMKKYPY